MIALATPKPSRSLSVLGPWIGSILILGTLGYLISNSDQFRTESIIDTLQRVGWLWTGIGLFCVLAQALSQGTRLWILLPRNSRPGWEPTLRIFSLGQVINSTLPARLGDVVKVGLLGSSSGAGSVFISDKVVDIASLGVIGLVALIAGLSDQIKGLGVSNPVIPFSTLIWSLVGISSLALIARLAWPRLPLSFQRRFRSLISGLKEGASSLGSPSQFFPALFMGVLAWFAELLLLVFLCHAAGHSLSPGAALASLLALNLGIALPVSVANIGTFEASLSFALTRFGIPASEALAIAVLHHLIQLVGVAVLALVFNWRGRRTQDHFRVKAEDKQRAVAYYETLSLDYNSAVARGPLKALRQREQQAIFDLARFTDPAAQTVIDVGCGGGFYALAAKRAGKHVTVTDLSPGMIDRMKGKVDETHVSDVESFTPGRTYDIVICSGVLDFVLDPAKAFSNLCRLVNPSGGRLVILAPRQGWGGFLYRLEKKLVKVHVNLYEEKWFREQAAFHGLQITRQRRPLPGNQALLFEPMPPLKSL
jgi:uncharacterized protein (TIRG00374 family)